MMHFYPCCDVPGLGTTDLEVDTFTKFYCRREERWLTIPEQFFESICMECQHCDADNEVVDADKICYDVPGGDVSIHHLIAMGART